MAIEKRDHLSALLYEMIRFIFCGLNPKEISSISSVSHLFYRVTNDDLLWKNKLTSDFLERQKHHPIPSAFRPTFYLNPINPMFEILARKGKKHLLDYYHTLVIGKTHDLQSIFFWKIICLQPVDKPEKWENHIFFRLLSTACQHGHLDALKVLIGRNTAYFGTDNTLVHIAAKNGHIPIMRWFESNGSPLDQDDHKGVTPLFYACRNGHLEAAQWLVMHKARINDSTMHAASIFGHLDVLQFLIEKQKAESKPGFLDLFTDIITEKKHPFLNSVWNNRYPIQWAAKRGHLRIIQYLAELGVDVNSSYEWRKKKSPILLAAQNGHYNAVVCLINLGANISEWELRELIDKDYFDIIQFLVQRKPELLTKANYHHALRHGSLKMVKHLSDFDQNINYLNSMFSTALHKAAQNKDINVTKLIFKKAPKLLNQEDENRITPLYAAAANGIPETISYLLKKGARINSWPDRRPLFISINNFNYKNSLILMQHYTEFNVYELEAIFKKESIYIMPLKSLLLKIKPDWIINPNAPGEVPTTLIHYAALYGDHIFLNSLISQNVNLNVQDASGKTPLHILCKQNYLDTAKLLLKSTPDMINVTDHKGQTALMIAASSGSECMVKYLIEENVDVNTGTYRGLTALHFAAEHQQPEIIKILLKNGALLDNGNYSTRELGEPELRLAMFLLNAEIRLQKMGTEHYNNEYTFFGSTWNFGYCAKEILAAAIALKRIVFDNADVNEACTNTVLHAAVLNNNELRELRQEFIGFRCQPKVLY